MGGAASAAAPLSPERDRSKEYSIHSPSPTKSTPATGLAGILQIMESQELEERRLLEATEDAAASGGFNTFHQSCEYRMKLYEMKQAQQDEYDLFVSLQQLTSELETRELLYAFRTPENLGDEMEMRWGPDFVHPTVTCATDFPQELVPLWTSKEGDVLDELLSMFKVHPTAYAGWPGDDAAAKQAFMLAKLSGAADGLVHELGQSYARYKRFTINGREHDILHIALVGILIYSMGPADVDQFFQHPDALRDKLSNGAMKRAYLERRREAADAFSHYGGAPFAQANEALRLCSGEQEKGAAFSNAEAARRGLADHIKFVCLLDAIAEELPADIPGAPKQVWQSLLDDLQSVVRLSGWKEKWDGRVLEAKQMVLDKVAYRGIACDFPGGAELVASWECLEAGALSASTSLTSIALSQSVPTQFLKAKVIPEPVDSPESSPDTPDIAEVDDKKAKPEEEPVINVLFEFRNMPRVVSLFLGSKYHQEMEILLPLLMVYKVTEKPSVREMALGKSAVPTKVLHVMLEPKGSTLDPSFRAKVLDDASRANNRIIATIQADRLRRACVERDIVEKKRELMALRLCPIRTYAPEPHWKSDVAWVKDTPGESAWHSDWQAGAPPSHCMSTSPETHTVFQGSAGFFVLDLGRVTRVTMLRTFRDEDEACPRGLILHGGDTVEGPWHNVGIFNASRDWDEWNESPWQNSEKFHARARYFRLSWDANYGNTEVTRIICVQFFVLIAGGTPR